MKALISLLITLILALFVFGGGMVYYVSHITPETLARGEGGRVFQARPA